MNVHFATPRARASERIWRSNSAAAAAARAALVPAELLFRLGSAVRRAGYDHGLAHSSACAVPVISVGNLTVGGTGKTPFVGWLAGELEALGCAPAILHGGYAEDEPELLRAWHADIPVLVQRDRVAAASAAVGSGAGVVVLDDGYQHRRLLRDLDIVLIAAEQWTARPRLLPRGPWREPLAALRRAGVIVVTRKSADRQRGREVATRAARFTAAPTAVLHLAPGGWRAGDERATDPPSAAPPSGEAVLVTAVAEWRPVAEHATAAGAQLAEALVFADHHPFDAADAERIRRFAGSRPVVCTAKDWVKLRRLLPAQRLAVLVQRLAFDSGEDQVRSAVRFALQR